MQPQGQGGRDRGSGRNSCNWEQLVLLQPELPLIRGDYRVINVALPLLKAPSRRALSRGPARQSLSTARPEVRGHNPPVGSVSGSPRPHRKGGCWGRTPGWGREVPRARRGPGRAGRLQYPSGTRGASGLSLELGCSCFWGVTPHGGSGTAGNEVVAFNGMHRRRLLMPGHRVQRAKPSRDPIPHPIGRSPLTPLLAHTRPRWLLAARGRFKEPKWIRDEEQAPARIAPLVSAAPACRSRQLQAPPFLPARPAQLAFLAD